MKIIRSLLRARLEEFNVWSESLPEKGLLTQLAVLLAVVFLLVVPLGTLIGLIAVWLPWVSVFVVSTCLLITGVSVIIACTFKTIQQRVLKLARKSMAVLICFWAGVLVFGIVCGIATHTASHIVSSKLQLPLGGLRAVAVDSKGRVYCASKFYNRLQVYNDQGRFLRGWFIPYLGRYSSMLKIDKADHIHVAIQVGRRDGSKVFDSDGHLLAITEDAGIFTQSDTASNLEARDSEGNIYRIQSSVLFPRVVKINPSGEESVLISDSFNLWLMNASFPVFGFLMVTGIIIIAISLRLKKRRQAW